MSLSLRFPPPAVGALLRRAAAYTLGTKVRLLVGHQAFVPPRVVVKRKDKDILWRRTKNNYIFCFFSYFC